VRSDKQSSSRPDTSIPPILPLHSNSDSEKDQDKKKSSKKKNPTQRNRHTDYGKNSTKIHVGSEGYNETATSPKNQELSEKLSDMNKQLEEKEKLPIIQDKQNMTIDIAITAEQTNGHEIRTSYAEHNYVSQQIPFQILLKEEILKRSERRTNERRLRMKDNPTVKTILASGIPILDIQASSTFQTGSSTDDIRDVHEILAAKTEEDKKKQHCAEDTEVRIKEEMIEDSILPTLGKESIEMTLNGEEEVCKSENFIEVDTRIMVALPQPDNELITESNIPMTKDCQKRRNREKLEGISSEIIIVEPKVKLKSPIVRETWTDHPSNRINEEIIKQLIQRQIHKTSAGRALIEQFHYCMNYRDILIQTCTSQQGIDDVNIRFIQLIENTREECKKLIQKSSEDSSTKLEVGKIFMKQKDLQRRSEAEIKGSESFIKIESEEPAETKDKYTSEGITTQSSESNTGKKERKLSL